jgi:hypothetical protein
VEFKACMEREKPIDFGRERFRKRGRLVDIDSDKCIILQSIREDSVKG